MKNLALQSGISHAGDKLGKKAAEKSGDLIMKKLGNMRIGSKKPPNKKQPARPQPTPSSGENSDEILNRLISGQGIRKKKNDLKWLFDRMNISKEMN